MRAGGRAGDAVGSVAGLQLRRWQPDPVAGAPDAPPRPCRRVPHGRDRRAGLHASRCRRVRSCRSPRPALFDGSRRAALSRVSWTIRTSRSSTSSTACSTRVWSSTPISCSRLRTSTWCTFASRHCCAPPIAYCRAPGAERGRLCAGDHR